MIQQTENGFEIRCDWLMCKTEPACGDTVQAATNHAKAEGWEKQIKRAGNGKQHIFDFCPAHAERGREFDTEGKYIKPPLLGFQK